MPRGRCIQCFHLLFLAAFAADHCDGQTLPTGILNAPPLVVGDFQSIGSNTTLNVLEGGLVGRSFEVGVGTGAVGDSVLDVAGGSIGSGLLALAGSVVNLREGGIADQFTALDGSTVNIQGGSVGRNLVAEEGSVVNISGGHVAHNFRAAEGSVVSVSGGVLDGFLVNRGSSVSISGGTWNDSIIADGDSTLIISGGVGSDSLYVGSNTNVNLIGTEFRLGGDLLDLGLGVATIITDRDVPLTAFLADGSPFELSLSTGNESSFDYFAPNATLSLTRVVPEPSSIFVLSIATIVGLSSRGGGPRSS